MTATGEPLWLALEPEPIYAVLHRPPASIRTQLAALLVPSFGWDNDCSYRRRRFWATQLAEAGISALRIDLPGTENSAGSALAPGRVESWIDAVDRAAEWLRHRSDCDRLVAVGIGLGGILAYEAVGRHAPIDDLVLWGVRASGRAYVRELRAYAAITAGDSSRAKQAMKDATCIGIGGHTMSVETAAALGTIDLTNTQLPDADRRRVLLIGRDANGVDEALRAHLAASGAEVTLLEAEDYHCLMSPPEVGAEPIATVSASVRWMQAAAAEQRAIVTPAIAHGLQKAQQSVRFRYRGTEIQEHVLQLRTSAGRLIGILSEPTGLGDEPISGGGATRNCLVVVNSGALRHTGPNRMFVEVARRAAAQGVTAVRIDLPGLGDSDGVPVKSFERTAADDVDSLATLREIYDHLEQLGVADHFVAGGFSLGGYLTIRLVLAEERLIGAISVNPTGLTWTDKQRQRVIRDLTALVGPDVIAPPSGRTRMPGRLLPPLEHLRQIRRSIDRGARRRLAHIDSLWRLEHRREIADVMRTLDELGDAGRRMVIVLSQDEQLLRILEQPRIASQLRHHQNIEVERLPDTDHLLRPLWIQDRVIDRFSSALTEFCSAADTPAVP